MIVNITDKAKEQIDNLCEKNNKWVVSLNMKGGGCADPLNTHGDS